MESDSLTKQLKTSAHCTILPWFSACMTLRPEVWRHQTCKVQFYDWLTEPVVKVWHAKSSRLVVNLNQNFQPITKQNLIRRQCLEKWRSSAGFGKFMQNLHVQEISLNSLCATTLNLQMMWYATNKTCIVKIFNFNLMQWHWFGSPIDSRP